MQELTRGANCPVPSARVAISVACASPVDVSALLVATTGKVRSDADLIFYNNASGPGVDYRTSSGAPDIVAVDTSRVPGDVDKVVVTASLDGSGPATFAQAGKMTVTVADGAGTADVRFELTGLTTEAALICLEVYRRGGGWKLRAVGQGFDDGLAGIATEFGIEVGDPPTPPAPAGAQAAPTPAGGGPASPPRAPATEAPPSGTTRVNLDKGRVSLAKNQTVSLVKTGARPLTKVAMGLGWDPASGRGEIDLDASVIAFDAAGKNVDTVWFMSKQGCKGAIRHSGDNVTGHGDGDDEVITVDLGALPTQVTALVFTVNSFAGQKFTAVANAYCRLLDVTSGSTELVRFDLTESKPQTGVIMCKLVREHAGRWAMTALGDFHDGKTVRSMEDPARRAL